MGLLLALTAALLTLGTPASWPVAARAANGCGVERWAVKTGTDNDAGKVNLNSATPTSIQYLVNQPRPDSPPPRNRVAPVETTEWILDATLVEYKLETDSDYHLVLHDAAGNSMVSEIPYPGCVDPSSPFAAGIRRARSQFDAQHSAGNYFTMTNAPVRITGVGFFDFRHGQTGVAPNAVELHPIVNIVFFPSGPLSGPARSPTPAARATPSGSPVALASPTLAATPSGAAVESPSPSPASGSPAPAGGGGGGAGISSVVIVAALVGAVGWGLRRRGRHR